MNYLSTNGSWVKGDQRDPIGVNMADPEGFDEVRGGMGSTREGSEEELGPLHRKNGLFRLTWRVSVNPGRIF